MASYHFAAQIIKRSAGRSAVAAAAYRAGEKLHDERQNVTHDYSQRGGVQHTEIMAPDDAPDWVYDRQNLWSAVEKKELRIDSQLAREVNIALAAELTNEQRYDLVREFVQEQFVSQGMVADVAWHQPQPDKGDHPDNYHAHIMLTLRRAGPDGLDPIKTRRWNSDALLKQWRSAWADHQNRYLERYGHEDRVDHRTLEAQRIDAVKRGDQVQAVLLNRTPEIHLGPKARPMANRQYEPQSKRRTVPVYGQARRERQVRYRHYDRHDRSSRYGFNLKIMANNALRLAAYIRRKRAQYARLQQKLRFWGKMVQLLASPVLPAKKKKFKPFKPKPITIMKQSVIQLGHAQQRRSLVTELMDSLMGALALLMFGFDAQQNRQQDMQRRHLPWAQQPARRPGQGRGRGRQRLREVPRGV
jgi:hypothetical protein